jgi:hypothetical protein
VTEEELSISVVREPEPGRKLPPDLLQALEEGELTDAQSRDLIAFEGER